ncbi:hypothetical protein AWW66_18320 [Micromonospora rosaria]|uniref:Uncharacterized protein n=1 Tax=Micromonospora rosaria TaxID=47874 RepID=A0A136PQQ6_9ACTN|nr:hypothetical protein [Micromonospora rosaria]KXK60546.1 hypothetical protein AWW66_18320 [Micromonospora rosaria]
MRDGNLVGLWDSSLYDYGVMESSWVCLRPDGTGWSAWANAGGAATSRLRWSCPGDGEVELRYTWTAEGRFAPGAPPFLVDVDDEGPDDTVVRTRFRVGPDTPPLSASPVTCLHVEEGIEYCHQFALVTRDVEDGPHV